MPTRSKAAAGEWRIFQVGIAIWLALAIAAGLNWIHLDLIEVLFLIAPWIIVPAAASLIPPLDQSPFSHLILRHTLPIFAAASFTTLAFFLPAGRFSGASAFCWLLICLFIAGDGLLRIWSYRLRSFSQLCFAAGEGYVAVGGAWLMMSRLGLQPSGFVEPIVLLTAVHFHFAGFLSCIFAGLCYGQLGATSWGKPLRAALLGVICGPGLLGLAFLIGPKLKLIAAMLVALGQIALAAGMANIAILRAHGLPRFLLLASALSVAAAMVFAAAWALGEYPLQPMTDLSQMARIHGVLNAAGFGCLGLFGWKGIGSVER